MLVVNITGFGKFGNIDDNPTTHIMNELTDYLKAHTLRSSRVKLGQLRVLPVKQKGMKKRLKRMYKKMEQRPNEVWIHLGVASSLGEFALEDTAYNEAHFRIADEGGDQPQRQIIRKSQKTQLCTKLIDVGRTVLTLRAQGFHLHRSHDPGRFLCNYVYFLSLSRSKRRSLFLHVPTFETVPLNNQLAFVRALLLQL